MKKLTILLSALTVALAVLSPAKAEARDYCGGTRVTVDSCGRTIYWEYVRVGFDCHGCPIFRWVVVRTCAPSYGGGYGGGHGGGYGHGHGYAPRPVYPCYPPRRPHCRH